MDLNDWILALHLLSAVALIGAEVLFSIMVVSLWRSSDAPRIASTMPLARVGTVLVGIGFAGTIVFGVWLAISLDRYQPWDGWIIAALVLWAIGGYTGQKAGEGYAAGGQRAAELTAQGTTTSPELAETFGATRAFWFHNATLRRRPPHRDRHDLEAGRMRPDSWNFPLLLHVAGAAVLFGAVAAAAVSTLAADRVPQPEFMRRLAFRSLLLVGLPAYIVMRIGAEWLYSKGFDELDDDPAWLSIGYIVADVGLLVFVIALVLAGVAMWKRNSGVAKAAGVLSIVLLVAMIVAVWAMGAKPN